MGSRVLPPYVHRQPQLQADTAPDGLKLLVDGFIQEPLLIPQRADAVSDTEDLFDVARQLQQVDMRQRLKTVVESNRAFRSRRSSSARGHQDTLASLKLAAARRDTRFSGLSNVSEASSDAYHVESSQPPYFSAVARETSSTQDAPASAEDGLSAFNDDITEDGRLSAHSHGFSAADKTLSTENFATKEELAAVLCCMRRLERKVDWLMSNERRGRPVHSCAVSCNRVSLLSRFYELLWLPAKASLKAIWPFSMLAPVFDMVESVGTFMFD